MHSLSKSIEEIRADFPILNQKINGYPLIYLDNAATMQVPSSVTEAITKHYQYDNANVHRGIHALSERSTNKLENARKKVQQFLNAGSSKQIVFTHGTTDSINMAADLIEPLLMSGEMKPTVVATALEHHANYVPWQQLSRRTKTNFETVGLRDNGDVDLKSLEQILDAGNVGLVSVTHVSNVLGTVNPIKQIVDMAHQAGALALVDAAQSIRHEIVDVRDLECDFLCFSGHKMCAGTGIGVLYLSNELTDRLSPVRFGGEMVDNVTKELTTFETAPLRFEAGTPNYVGAIALSSAIDYLDSLGREAVAQREHDLCHYALLCLSSIGEVSVLGSPQKRAGCISFVVDGAHPFDIASLMDAQGIALRSGSQCAQPLLKGTYGIKHVVRISPAFYNTYDEIDLMADALKRTISILKRTS